MAVSIQDSQRAAAEQRKANESGWLGGGCYGCTSSDCDGCAAIFGIVCCSAGYCCAHGWKEIEKDRRSSEGWMCVIIGLLSFMAILSLAYFFYVNANKPPESPHNSTISPIHNSSLDNLNRTMLRNISEITSTIKPLINSSTSA